MILLRVDVDGVPPFNASRVLVWRKSFWELARSRSYPDEGEVMWILGIGGIYVDEHPIYHKLPDDYVEGE